MNVPRKRNSAVIKELTEQKDPQESKRTRTRMLLAGRILKELKRRNWSRVKFAEEMGKKPSVVTRWLSGNHNFTSDILSDIEYILNIELLALYKDTSNQPVETRLPLVNAMVYDDLKSTVEIEEGFFEVCNYWDSGGTSLDIKSVPSKSQLT